MSDGSCKQFLEDLLLAVRQGLERKRTDSNSSVVSSGPGLTASSGHQESDERLPAGSSTPKRNDGRTQSIDDDMRYIGKIRGHVIVVFK